MGLEVYASPGFAACSIGRSEEMTEAFSGLVPGSASLCPSQARAREPAERHQPKQGRQAWEAKGGLQAELPEELEGLLFATHGPGACEDLAVGCW